MYLPYLDYFRTVAKYLNMTKAAEKLHISQSAVSQTISKLEDELGVALFARSHGKLKLTEAGKVYLICVDNAFTELEKGRLQIANYKQHRANAVSFSGSFPHFITDIANNFPSEHPDIRINPFIYTTDQAITKMVSGELDFALLPDCRQAAFESGLVLEQLFEEPLMLLVNKSHPLAEMPIINLSDVRYDVFVLNTQNFDLETFYSYFAREQFTPEIMLNSNEPRILNLLIGSGQAICLCPASDLVRDFSEPQFNHDMKALKITNQLCNRKVMLVTANEQELSENALVIIEYIKEFFKKENKAVINFLGSCSVKPQPRLYEED